MDEELRVVTCADGVVPELQIQPWAYSLAAGGWAQAEGPVELQVQFTQHLCEILLERAESLRPERVEDRLTPPTRIPLGPDVELRVGEAEGDQEVMLDLALWRCSPNDATREFHRTAAGMRLPAHLTSLVTEGIQRVAKRATERRLFAPATSDG